VCCSTLSLCPPGCFTVCVARPTPSLPRIRSTRMPFRPGYLSDPSGLMDFYAPVSDVRSFNLFFYIYSSFSLTNLIFFIPLFITLKCRPNSFIFYNILHSGLLYNVYGTLEAFVIFVQIQYGTIHFFKSAPAFAHSFLRN
jgi:hypothetical protein